MNKNQLNTVVSACMKIFNSLSDAENIDVLSEGMQILLKLLSPYAPHISDYLWIHLKFGNTIHTQNWPIPCEKALIIDQFTLIVQINGKLRDRISIDAKASQKEIESQIMQLPIVQSSLLNKQCKKIIYIPKKIINMVIV